jgi:hypothetical protein
MLLCWFSGIYVSFSGSYRFVHHSCCRNGRHLINVLRLVFRGDTMLPQQPGSSPPRGTRRTRNSVIRWRPKYTYVDKAMYSGSNAIKLNAAAEPESELHMLTGVPYVTPWKTAMIPYAVRRINAGEAARSHCRNYIVLILA